jgi:hypothetical protein
MKQKEKKIMNEVVRTGGGDGWDSHSSEGSGFIRGPMIKFADWRYTRGGEPFALADTSQFLAIDLAMAWVKFVEGEPPVHVLQQRNGYLPDRNTLGDLDESKWEMKFGERQDPWHNTRYVYFFNPDSAEISTFTTSSGGGRFAVDQLAGQVKLKRRFTPGACPIIELRAAKWGKQFPKSRPDLKVVGWQAIGSGGQPQQLAAPVGPIPAPLSGEAPPKHDDMSDHIPF